ncbi:DUF3606 domain-containing protein [Sphingobium sp.]|uniref:DUF3606 domain-containing protein n=1 Tax=Sphingobium sp. TaxID=1912891 RepID=UPI003BB53525
MSAQPGRASPRDVNRVSLEQDRDVQYWTNRFGVSREELEEAVETVGESVDAVAVYLNR